MKEKDLLDYLEIIYYRKRTLLLIMGSAVVVAILLSLVLPSFYKAKASLFAIANPEDLTYTTSDSDEVILPPPIPVYKEDALQIYLGVFKSQSVLHRVQKRFPNIPPSKVKNSSDFDITDEMLLEVSYIHHNSVTAADVANAFCEELSGFFVDYALAQAKEASQVVESKYNQAKEDLLATEQVLRDYKEENLTVDIDQEIRNLLDEHSARISELLSTKISLTENDVKLRVTEAQLNETAKMEISQEIFSENPAISQLRSQLVDLETQLAGALRWRTEKHPEVQTTKKKIEDIKVRLSTEVDRILSSQTSSKTPTYENLKQSYVDLQVSHHSLSAKKEALERVLKEVEAGILTKPQIKQEYSSLVREVGLKEDFYLKISTRLTEAKIQETHKFSPFIVVDLATPSEKPTFPNLPVNVIVALGFSFATGIFFCFFLEYLENLKAKKEGEVFEL